LGGRLLTSDDLQGVMQGRIEEIINDVVINSLAGEKTSFSDHHYVLHR
jgi:hypothetical protein